jgi:hypothetical protein
MQIPQQTFQQLIEVLLMLFLSLLGLRPYSLDDQVISLSILLKAFYINL